MTDKEKAELDQGMALLADTLPSTWARMYRNLIKEKFTKDEAMDILKTYILSQGVK